MAKERRIDHRMHRILNRLIHRSIGSRGLDPSLDGEYFIQWRDDLLFVQNVRMESYNIAMDPREIDPPCTKTQLAELVRTRLLWGLKDFQTRIGEHIQRLEKGPDDDTGTKG